MSGPTTRVHVLAILWAAVVAGLLLMPLGGLPEEPTWMPAALAAVADKLMHVALFFVCALLFARSAQAAGWRRALVVAALAATAYGGLLELLQGLVGREMSWGDLVADGLGALAATLPLPWLERAPR